MTTNDDWISPDHRPAPQVPRARRGEQAWRVTKDGHTIGCELRNDGRVGAGWDADERRPSPTLTSFLAVLWPWASFGRRLVSPPDACLCRQSRQGAKLLFVGDQPLQHKFDAVELSGAVSVSGRHGRHSTLSPRHVCLLKGRTRDE